MSPGHSAKIKEPLLLKEQYFAASNCVIFDDCASCKIGKGPLEVRADRGIGVSRGPEVNCCHNTLLKPPVSLLSRAACEL